MYSVCEHIRAFAERSAGMAKIEDQKGDRLQVRLDTRDKSILQRAAGYRHETVSQFVLGTALEEARRVIRAHEVASLSETDWTLFYDALIDPPEPNPALRAAFARFKNAGG